MKLSHALTAMLIVGIVSSAFLGLITNLKTNYSSTFDTSNVNLSRFGGYDKGEELNEIAERVENATDVPSGQDTDLDVTLVSRFLNVFREISDSFKSALAMVSQGAKMLEIPSAIVGSVLLIISLFFLLKMGLGYFDR